MKATPQKIKCPRCRSSRVDKRLSGAKYCKRCGQRWHKHGLLIPSFDRRKGADKKKDDDQLFFTI